MSEESGDDSSKTEEPSQKRLDDARQKGQTFSSREINHFFMILALTAFVLVLAKATSMNTLKALSNFITQPDEFPTDPASIHHMLGDITSRASEILILPLLVTFIAAFAPAVVQGKFTVSAESIKPKFSKISPMAGLKRLYSMKSAVEFLKNILKVGIAATIVAIVALPFKKQLPTLMTTGPAHMIMYAQEVAGKMLIATCIFLFFLAIMDYAYQRFSFMKSMRMTKQEVKEEYKNQEGDPHIKGRIRQLRRERAQKRMMANVPRADVVITNPTHYAVALEYDAQTMAAPKVVAKGADEVAARIRESATKHKIPIVRNPPLARVLYDTAKLDEQIPFEHFQAVAKIIGYVYKLKGKTPKKPPPKQPKPKGKQMPTVTLKKK